LPLHFYFKGHTCLSRSTHTRGGARATHTNPRAAELHMSDPRPSRMTPLSPIKKLYAMSSNPVKETWIYWSQMQHHYSTYIKSVCMYNVVR